MTDTEYQQYLKSPEWKAKALARLKIDDFRCAMCGCRGTAVNALEVHHMGYRNLKEENPYTDLVTLCHVCHKSVHHLMERTTSADGRRGWRDARIPTIHVYTLSGDNVEYQEE